MPNNLEGFVKNIMDTERTWEDLRGPGTWEDLVGGPGRTWEDLEGLGRTC